VLQSSVGQFNRRNWLRGQLRFARGVSRGFVLRFVAVADCG
jgi:hypothetical protein